jgi:hypothetical protein
MTTFNMLLIVQLFFYLQSFLLGGDGDVVLISEPAKMIESRSEAELIYEPMRDCMNRDAFLKAYAGIQKWNPCAEMIAIADFSKPSDQQRFYIISE